MEGFGVGLNSTHTVDYKLQSMGNLFKKPAEKIESTNTTCVYTPLDSRWVKLKTWGIFSSGTTIGIFCMLD